MQEHFYEHFHSDGDNGFLEDIAITLIDKNDGRDPKNRGNYWMRTLKMLQPDGLSIEDCVWQNTIYIYHLSYYTNAFSYLVGNTLGHEWY